MYENSNLNDHKSSIMDKILWSAHLLKRNDHWLGDGDD